MMSSAHRVKIAFTLSPGEKRYEYDSDKGEFVHVEAKDAVSGRIAIYFSTNLVPDSSDKGASFYMFAQELTRRLMLSKEDLETIQILSELKAPSVTGYRFEKPHVKNIYAMAEEAFYRAYSLGNKEALEQVKEEGHFPSFEEVLANAESEEVVRYRAKKQRKSERQAKLQTEETAKQLSTGLGQTNEEVPSFASSSHNHWASVTTLPKAAQNPRNTAYKPSSRSIESRHTHR